MDRLLNAIKLHAGSMDMASAQLRIGVVRSYDPTNAAAKVQIQPEGVLTGWLPVGQLSAGLASIVAPPSPGEQVVCAAQEGDAEQWIIVGRLFSTEAMPPVSPFTGAPVQSGEVAVFGQAGACLHMQADGTWGLAGDLHVTGNITATGNVTAASGGGSSVDLLAHRHGGVQTGGGSTGAPTPGT